MRRNEYANGEWKPERLNLKPFFETPTELTLNGYKSLVAPIIPDGVSRSCKVCFNSQTHMMSVEKIEGKKKPVWYWCGCSLDELTNEKK